MVTGPELTRRGDVPAAVSKQGELGNYQHSPAGIKQGEIHLSLTVFKDTQVDDFLSKPGYVPVLIITMDAQQNQQSRADGTNFTIVNSNPG